MKVLCSCGVILALLAASPALADGHQPMIWPTVRYGAPERLSVGVAIQPPLPGVWNHLVGIATWGKGGAKAGVGIGRFGGDLMAGYAILGTILRATPHSRDAGADQIFLGIEGQLMLGNWSVRAGPSVRMHRLPDGGDRIRFSWSVGLGF